jgi:hypothetical protein
MNETIIGMLKVWFWLSIGLFNVLALADLARWIGQWILIRWNRENVHKITLKELERIKRRYERAAGLPSGSLKLNLQIDRIEEKHAD